LFCIIESYHEALRAPWRGHQDKNEPRSDTNLHEIEKRQKSIRGKVGWIRGMGRRQETEDRGQETRGDRGIREFRHGRICAALRLRFVATVGIRRIGDLPIDSAQLPANLRY